MPFKKPLTEVTLKIVEDRPKHRENHAIIETLGRTFMLLRSNQPTIFDYIDTCVDILKLEE